MPNFEKGIVQVPLESLSEGATKGISRLLLEQGGQIRASNFVSSLVCTVFL